MFLPRMASPGHDVISVRRPRLEVKSSLVPWSKIPWRLLLKILGQVSPTVKNRAWRNLSGSGVISRETMSARTSCDNVTLLQTAARPEGYEFVLSGNGWSGPTRTISIAVRVHAVRLLCTPFTHNGAHAQEAGAGGMFFCFTHTTDVWDKHSTLGAFQSSLKKNQRQIAWVGSNPTIVICLDFLFSTK